MWHDSSLAVAPRHFKAALEAVAPIFRGWEQQDSHEFIRVVLDCLHEALNVGRKVKVTAEAPSSVGRNPQSMCAEAWQEYLARNQSIVQGMLFSSWCLVVAWRILTPKHQSCLVDSCATLLSVWVAVMRATLSMHF